MTTTFSGSGKKTPTPAQQEVLDLIHQRCLYEYYIEQGMDLPMNLAQSHRAPLYRLVHGLPGAGKSQILKWLRSYFEEVWQWQHGNEFVFVAGQNTMADNIEGCTLHSYFALPFRDKRNVLINSSYARDWSSKLSKMNVLRFIFVDEIEAAGADLIGKVEEEVRLHTRRDKFRFPEPSEYEEDVRLHMPRGWGGVNVVFIGDWWQLHPTGGIAFMANPLRTVVRENALARTIVESVWCMGQEGPDATEFVLQRWSNNERVLQLSTNIRSGEDAWWNEVLEQCRLGALSEDNYNWMHGFPAKTSISAAQHPFWYEFRKASEPPCTNLACGNACEACRNELARRNLLFAEDRLPEGFEEAMLITPHNQAVLQYALRRARDFAKRRGEQLMWCVLH